MHCSLSEEAILQRLIVNGSPVVETTNRSKNENILVFLNIAAVNISKLLLISNENKRESWINIRFRNNPPLTDGMTVLKQPQKNSLFRGNKIK